MCKDNKIVVIKEDKLQIKEEIYDDWLNLNLDKIFETNKYSDFDKCFIDIDSPLTLTDSLKLNFIEADIIKINAGGKEIVVKVYGDYIYTLLKDTLFKSAQSLNVCEKPDPYEEINYSEKPIKSK
jgi:hypothetical protein